MSFGREWERGQSATKIFTALRDHELQLVAEGLARAGIAVCLTVSPEPFYHFERISGRGVQSRAADVFEP